MLLDYNGELPKEFFNKGFLHATIGTISEAQQVFESLINDCDVKNLWFEKYSGIKDSSVPPFSVNNSLDEFFRKNEILEKIRFASGRKQAKKPFTGLFALFAPLTNPSFLITRTCIQN